MESGHQRLATSAFFVARDRCTTRAPALGVRRNLRNLRSATARDHESRGSHIAGSERTEAVGIGTEVFGGLAVIALGVLALFGVSPLTLLPVAALVLGVALLLGGPAQP